MAKKVGYGKFLKRSEAEEFARSRRRAFPRYKFTIESTTVRAYQVTSVLKKK